MSFKTFNIGDRDYEVEVTGISYDAEEVYLAPFVEVSGADSGEEVVTLDTFLTEWAVYQGRGFESARLDVEDRCRDSHLDSLHADYADSRATWWEAYL